MSSRMKKSMNNMIFGMIEQVVTVLLTFITRTIFIKILDANLIGINGLFTNVLTILSIAELGFGTAIIYGMYKPILENDKKKIAALMSYYKKIYNRLAVFIAIVGIAIIPFLKYIVNADLEIQDIIIYYLIFLCDTVCSYLLANRVAIIQATQNLYIIKKYTTFFVVLKNVLQILALIIFQNFIIYLLIQVLTTFATNLYGAKLAKKLYPYTFEDIPLEENEKKSIIENVKSMSLYKLGGVIMHNTDNILISVMTGTINVGYYANYSMIISAINRFSNNIFNAITASVGNLNAGEEKNKKIDILYRIDFFANWLFGILSIALFILFNDFICLWIGNEYLLSDITVFAIVLNFYIVGILNPIMTYRDTTGLFRQTKYVFLITALINLILSIGLGKIWGIFGILLASSIARVLTNFWYEPYMLFNNYFKISSKNYFINRLINISLIVIGIIILNYIFKIIGLLKVETVLEFLSKCCITLIISNIIFLISYRNRKEFKFFGDMICGIMERGMKKWKKK